MFYKNKTKTKMLKLSLNFRFTVYITSFCSKFKGIQQKPNYSGTLNMKSIFFFLLFVVFCNFLPSDAIVGGRKKFKTNYQMRNNLNVIRTLIKNNQEMKEVCSIFD